MFCGFTEKTFEFFMAIGFNNNREFFHENHEWYVDSVREPLRDLAAELAQTIEAIDPDLERRPERTVSRLNRDIRFSRDKSPYRDYMWIGFHPANANASAPGFYMDISAVSIGWGMGYYEEHREKMDVFRRRLTAETETFRRLALPLEELYRVDRQVYKRMAVPEELPAELRTWYPLRSFSVNAGTSDMQTMLSADLPRRIKADYLRMKPLYDYFLSL